MSPFTDTSFQFAPRADATLPLYGGPSSPATLMSFPGPTPKPAATSPLKGPDAFFTPQRADEIDRLKQALERSEQQNRQQAAALANAANTISRHESVIKAMSSRHEAEIKELKSQLFQKDTTLECNVMLYGQLWDQYTRLLASNGIVPPGVSSGSGSKS